MSSCPWKCVPTAISSGMGIANFPSCHLLQQMKSQWESEKTLQGKMSDVLSGYLSDFTLFLSPKTYHYYQRYRNQIGVNHTSL